MNNYISFGPSGSTKQYKTPAKAWQPSTVVPATHRYLNNGNLDSTFGAASFMEWAGEIEAPPSASGSWGTIANLRTALKTRELLSFTDHYGTAYTVQAIGPFTERSLGPMWDSAENNIYVTVRLRAKLA